MKNGSFPRFSASSRPFIVNGPVIGQAVPGFRITGKGRKICAAEIIGIVEAPDLEDDALGKAGRAGENMGAAARAKFARDRVLEIRSGKTLHRA